jgi:hypothetical protein
VTLYARMAGDGVQTFSRRDGRLQGVAVADRRAIGDAETLRDAGYVVIHALQLSASDGHGYYVVAPLETCQRLVHARLMQSGRDETDLSPAELEYELVLAGQWWSAAVEAGVIPGDQR